jgi:hypothetical protein
MKQAWEFAILSAEISKATFGVTDFGSKDFKEPRDSREA